MPEPEAPSYVLTLVILLSSCLGLLVVLLLMVFRISGRLARLERQGVQGRAEAPSVGGGQSLPAAETSAGGAFELFLSEDPARREMTKGEQFAAYRQWRQEKGMNWSNS